MIGEEELVKKGLGNIYHNLYVATKASDIGILKELFHIITSEPGKDCISYLINFKNKLNGVNLLYVAAENGNEEIVGLLLSIEEVDANIECNNGCSPLSAACKNGHIRIIELLLEAGSLDGNRSNLGIRFIIKTTLLHWAAYYGYIDIIRKLLAINESLEIAEIGVDVRDKYEKTPIHHAIMNGQADAVTVLFDAGASLASKEDHVAIFAAEKGREDIVSILCETMAKNGCLHEVAPSMLDKAIEFKRERILEILLPYIISADLEKDNTKHLHQVIYNFQISSQVIVNILKLIYNKDWFIRGINLTNEHGTSLLHVMANNGNAEAVDCLIDAGAEANIDDNNGRTALHLAAIIGCIKTVSTLRRAVALESKDTCGHSPWKLATANQHYAVAGCLHYGFAIEDESNGQEECKADAEISKEWVVVSRP